MSADKFWDGVSGVGRWLAGNVGGQVARTDYATEIREDGTLGSVRAKTLLGTTDITREGPSTRAGGSSPVGSTYPVSSWQDTPMAKYSAKGAQWMAFWAQGLGTPDKVDVGNCVFLGTKFVFQNYSAAIQGTRVPPNNQNLRGFSSLQVVLKSYGGSIVDEALDADEAGQGQSFRFPPIEFPPNTAAMEASILPLKYKDGVAHFVVVARMRVSAGGAVTRLWRGSATPVKYIDGQPYPNTLEEITPSTTLEGNAEMPHHATNGFTSLHPRCSEFYSFGPGRVAAIVRTVDTYEQDGLEEATYVIPQYTRIESETLPQFRVVHAFNELEYVHEEEHMVRIDGVWGLRAAVPGYIDLGEVGTRTTTLRWKRFAPSTAKCELVVYDIESGWTREEISAPTADIFVPGRGSRVRSMWYGGDVQVMETVEVNYPVVTIPFPDSLYETQRFYPWVTVPSFSIQSYVVSAGPNNDAFTITYHYFWHEDDGLRTGGYGVITPTEVMDRTTNRRRAEYPQGSAAIVWAGNTTFACIPGTRELVRTSYTYPWRTFGSELIINGKVERYEYTVSGVPPQTGAYIWDYPNFAPLMYRKTGDGSFVRISWPGDSFCFEGQNEKYEPFDLADSFVTATTKYLIQRHPEREAWLEYSTAFDSREAWYSAGDGCAIFFFTDDPLNLDALVTGVATTDGGESWSVRTFANTRTMDSICLISPGTEKEIQTRIEAAREKATLGAFGPKQEEVYRKASFIFAEYRDGKRQLMRMTADMSVVEEWGPPTDEPGRRGLINIEGPIHPGFPGAYEAET